ncbi:MAG TPA: WYL domain-containing protein [Ignavibacteria bacterium]|nr:WYL domain-containing protein [Ignavibacteria bacterium]HMQ98772.1 WYL domain-containing protein [Ignavibacteria bacterium]
MQDIRSKFKRQLEIVGLILSQNYSGILRSADLSYIFEVEELTIMRDLQQLRSIGIDIHSTKKEGVCINKKLPEPKLLELISQYSSLSQSPAFADKSTKLLVSRLGEKSLANFVILQMAAEKNLVAAIDYEKDNGMLDFGREICPVLVFQIDNYWRVLTCSDGKFKQFHLNKILEARHTERSFSKIPDSILEDVFRFSWKSWVGTDKIDIKLLFSTVWKERILPKQLMTSETFTESADGNFIYETTVNSIDELASWIVSRGSGVKVIEPDELKTRVITLAKETLANYEID